MKVSEDVEKFGVVRIKLLKVISLVSLLTKLTLLYRVPPRFLMGNWV
jgi:hypothetical protein